MALPPIRAALQRTMAATAADEAAHANAVYSFWRPMAVPTKTRAYVPGLKWNADCSSGYRDVCWWTPGAPDPFDNGWSSWGNSSTIWMELPHITLAEAEPGDAVTFGASGDHHVSMLYEKIGSWWDVWNFGRQGQPVIVPLAYEIADHEGMPVTFCKLMDDPPATPEDKLRAKTGFWAWLAWYLGEGRHGWKPYGARNPDVRPNVPKKISADWWAQEKAFVAARNKGNP